MQTQIFTDAAAFDTLASEWDDLFDRATPPFFVNRRYQKIWWQYLGQGDLLLIAVRDDDGRLVGLAPLYTHQNDSGQRQLSFVGCVDVSDYLDILADPAHIEAVHQALLDCLADIEWKALTLCSLPHQSLTHTKLADAAQARGWQTTVDEQDVCPVITLAENWDDYLAGINKKQRHEIRRKMRKIEREAETEWYAVESETEVVTAMTEFIDLHQKSTADKEDFWNDDMAAFFKAIAVEAARAGWLKLYFIRVNGVNAAAMLCFDFNNEFLLYNSGYDPAQFAELSPGNVLTSYTIQHAISLGRTRYDFLRGDEVYKFRFGAEPEPVFDLAMHRPAQGS